eukprot:366039-Chlamydomonas_euryale.AAC.23
MRGLRRAWERMPVRAGVWLSDTATQFGEERACHAAALISPCAPHLQELADENGVLDEDARRALLATLDLPALMARAVTVSAPWFADMRQGGDAGRELLSVNHGVNLPLSHTPAC